MIPVRSLSLRLALPFLAFVVVGSTALVAWLQFEEVRESHGAFAATARANAHFVRSQRLPMTERTAQALGEVLGMEIYFSRGNPPSTLPDTAARLATREGAALDRALLAPPGEVRGAGSGEAVRVPIDAETSLVIFRVAPTGNGLWRLRTFAVLGAFWLLSLALAWVLASGIVGPLRRLAQRLPRIADDASEPALPESGRPDEIGQLARAYLDTRTALATERRAREQAERLATLGRMATGLAHEINNPVAAIKLHAQLLETDSSSSPAAARDSLEVIVAEAAKIEGLVSQWMFLARPQPPQVSPCELSEIVAASVRANSPSARHSGVQLVNEIGSGLTVNGDARRLSQAIGNIIINAIQAMAARGGTLRISGNDECQMPPGRSPSHDASFVIRHPSFVIHFHDTGPGFSAAALARHGELFFSEKEGGMGIGLTVTSEIIRAHGGELRVANSPAGGATVTCILPLAADPKSEIRNQKS